MCVYIYIYLSLSLFLALCGASYSSVTEEKHREDRNTGLLGKMLGRVLGLENAIFNKILLIENGPFWSFWAPRPGILG